MLSISNFFIVLTLAAVTVSAKQCALNYGNYEAVFNAVNGTVYFRVSIQMGASVNNAWTAIGFGQSMNSGLDVIMIRILNGRIVVTDEYVRGYTRPVADRMNNVQIGSVNYSNGILVISFSRPIHTFDPMDHSLFGCTPWQFVASLSRMSPQGSVFHHDRTPRRELICLQQCTN
ncbi:unnamed protein product [Auanema sp. JU1783]|nr:unnamed protein product [Auanema sp. JU1783]